ncbi:hypothetical protein SB00610_03769 [Klebsiella quasipneumoniae subsp. similipneumoniae]|nr:hypothetical protein SB00610_03769 [Klebsiella quasipneumoniae subsp. similipneumoniae]
MVNIPGVGFRFIDIAIQAHCQRFAGQWAAEIEVSAISRAFLVVFRLIGKKRQGTVPVVGRAFGNNVDHSAGRTGTITRGCRAAEDFNSLDHLGRDPVAVAPGIAFAAPAIANRVT